MCNAKTNMDLSPLFDRPDWNQNVKVRVRTDAAKRNSAATRTFSLSKTVLWQSEYLRSAMSAMWQREEEEVSLLVPDAEAAEIVLRFMYGAELPHDVSTELLAKVYETADMLIVPKQRLDVIGNALSATLVRTWKAEPRAILTMLELSDGRPNLETLRNLSVQLIREMFRLEAHDEAIRQNCLLKAYGDVPSVIHSRSNNNGTPYLRAF